MKLYLQSIAVFTILLLFSCTKSNNKISVEDTASEQQNETANVMPPCIIKKIEEIKNQPRGRSASSVYSYHYKGKTVYLFNASCCDQFNYLYDENCNIICAPSGGITGRGDGRCADFASGRDIEQLLWKDNR